jgi:hypothetical protein
MICNVRVRQLAIAELDISCYCHLLCPITGTFAALGSCEQIADRTGTIRRARHRLAIILAGPVLLGLALLAVRNRVKR